MFFFNWRYLYVSLFPILHGICKFFFEKVEWSSFTCFYPLRMLIFILHWRNSNIYYLWGTDERSDMYKFFKKVKLPKDFDSDGLNPSCFQLILGLETDPNCVWVKVFHLKFNLDCLVLEKPFPSRIRAKFEHLYILVLYKIYT